MWLLNIIGLILLTLVIIDGLWHWSIGGRSRYPVRRLVYNTVATVLGGLLIWLK